MVTCVVTVIIVALHSSHQYLAASTHATGIPFLRQDTMTTPSHIQRLLTNFLSSMISKYGHPSTGSSAPFDNMSNRDL
ncbi:hypothetical protein BDZ91DRAFT_742571 [Kalaharituber pfeilii]|nr:hypothetical protein BDZ91DRAFT_742571 [Kalaharituber pfeilii]